MAFKLHSRLVFFNICAIVVVTLFMGYFLSSSLRTTFESEIEGQLYTSASLAKDYMRVSPLRGDPIELANDISHTLDVRVTLIDRGGKVLGDSDLTPEGIAAVENHSGRPEVMTAEETGRGTAIRRSATVGVPFIYVAVKLEDGGVLRVARPLEPVETLIGGLRQQLVAALIVSIGLALVFGYMVYIFVSRPLHRMAEASHELAVGNLNSELPVVGDSDLAVMGSSLNAMARSLKKQMEELQGDKRRIEAIVEAMSAGIIVFDRDARVVLANNSICKLLDIHGEPAGRMPMELVRHPALETAVREALRGADVPAVDLTTGGGRFLSAKAAPVRSLSGQTELAVVVFHDLTEIRRTETMRKDFIANVSHEFKTPLTSIRGYAETLIDTAAHDPEHTREFLETIQRNATLLQALVDDLLVLAQLESEPPVEKQPIVVKELIEEQIRSRQHLVNDKRIQIMLDCPTVEIHADHSRLARALSNLLDNAIHYNKSGGQIRISGRTSSSGFAVDIADTGSGIPQGDLVRVFERFYRVEKSRTRESGGTGLGLAIAKHAVESQGGTISVSSRLGSGSTFTITLPA
jgi:two-component system, OmpR family, phosphate regulon sensor histidine kinase PhoR